VIKGATIKQRKLGSQGLIVSELGCRGMSQFYGCGDEAESITTIHRALELGVIPIHEMLDTNTFLAPPLVRGAGGVDV
jgi:hypothetical protein